MQKGDELADGRDFERGSNDDHEVSQIAVDIDQTARELVGERLAKECDVGLHDAALAGHVVLGIAGAVVVAGATAGLLLGAVAHELALAAVLGATAGGGAFGAVGQTAGLDVGEDLLAWDFVVAFDAGCGGKRAVTVRIESLASRLVARGK